MAGRRCDADKFAVSVKRGGIIEKHPDWCVGKPLLAVEDPQDAGRDISRNAFHIAKVIAAFKEASAKLEAANSNNNLKVDDDGNAKLADSTMKDNNFPILCQLLNIDKLINIDKVINADEGPVSNSAILQKQKLAKAPLHDSATPNRKRGPSETSNLRIENENQIIKKSRSAGHNESESNEQQKLETKDKKRPSNKSFTRNLVWKREI